MKPSCCMRRVSIGLQPCFDCRQCRRGPCRPSAPRPRRPRVQQYCMSVQPLNFNVSSSRSTCRLPPPLPVLFPNRIVQPITCRSPVRNAALTLTYRVVSRCKLRFAACPPRQPPAGGSLRLSSLVCARYFISATPRLQRLRQQTPLF